MTTGPTGHKSSISMSQGFNPVFQCLSMFQFQCISMSQYFNVPFQVDAINVWFLIVMVHIVLLYTIISTTSKRKATDLVAYLNYVPPKTEKHFWLSLETGVDLVKRQYCKKKKQFLSSIMSRFHASLSNYLTFFWISH